MSKIMDNMIRDFTKAFPPTKSEIRRRLDEFEKRIRTEVTQECYNECLAVECGEGECATAIATRFPDLITRL